MVSKVAKLLVLLVAVVHVAIAVTESNAVLIATGQLKRNVNHVSNTWCFVSWEIPNSS